MTLGTEHELDAGALTGRAAVGGASWVFSWPLLVGVWVYLFSLNRAKDLLLDGDTYWHITAGQWIIRNGTVPTTDPFSHTKQGVAWTAHEWLSEVVLAVAHDMGGWTAVVSVTALAFAATIALLVRALLRLLEPIYALLFSVLAVSMTAAHLLARPHILAMPLLMIWTIELVRASESHRAPRAWMLPVMMLWANLHGGFTLGIALAGVFAAEALITSTREQRMAIGRSWGIFLALAAASAVVTPHGPQGILFTWQILSEHGYALERVGEWRSPNFQVFQPLELWLLGGLALVLHQGLRLPPVRLVLIVGLLHLALKHSRNIELVGLLAPLFLASSFAEQWRAAQRNKPQLDRVDQFFRKLSGPAGQIPILIGFATLVLATLWLARVRPVELPGSVAPALAVNAVQRAGIKGPVLNSYESGGYLIYTGIRPFIDGRNDVYGDDFLKQYIEALELKASLPAFLAEHKIAWTLLTPDTPAVAMLDHLSHWRRIYADKSAVVHVNVDYEAPPQPSALK